MSTSAETCQNCGGSLEPDALGAICPACMVGDALEPLGTAAEADTAHLAPTSEDLLRSDPLEGTTLGIGGRYKILQKIGEGGFGTVYMAEQSAPMRRRVALKILKAGMDTRQLLARFEAERQALAMMDHPNIAKVLDGGETEQGRPFFVMDLVRGTPITAHCDEESLSTRQRLDLFLKVCQAVQHAHQKGIIHRDLKPTNILVTVEDGAEPVPKVIDFGVAKAMESNLTDKTLFTRFEQMIGTPAYMSPEQAGPKAAQDVDTRADIYALGVLLYELLTGTTPFDSRTLQSAAFDEVRRILREEEAPRPSARLGSMEIARRTTIAKDRGTEANSLGKHLRGDLDWIVMKAIEKDRRRRYETANALAMDVERHLANEPVTAGPPTVSYRFSKFLRRNKAGVGIAAIVLLSLIGGLALATVGFARAKDEAEKAREAEGLAQGSEDEARKSEAEARAAEQKAKADRDRLDAVHEFLTTDLLGQTSSRTIAEPSLTMRTALDRAVEKIDERFPDDPLARAQIHLIVAEAYATLSSGNEWNTHVRERYEILKRELAPDDPLLLSAQSAYGFALCQNGREAEGLALLEKTVQQQRAVLGESHDDTLSTQLSILQCVPDPEATGMAREFLARLENAQEIDRGWTGSARALLAQFLSKSGDPVHHAECERLFLEALADAEAEYGKDHRYRLYRLQNLADHYRRHDLKPERASELYLEIAAGLATARGSADASVHNIHDHLSEIALKVSMNSGGVHAENLIRGEVERVVRAEGLEAACELPLFQTLLATHFEITGGEGMENVVLEMAKLDPSSPSEKEVMKISTEARMSAAMTVGGQRARRSKWTEARTAYETATEIGSRDLMSAEDLKRHALILLKGASTESFREMASYMVERFKDSKEPSELRETIRINYLLPDQFELKAPRDLEVLQEMESRLAVIKVWDALAVGIAGYRRDDGATSWLGASAGADEKRLGAGGIRGLCAPAAHAVLACIIARAGDERLARELLERAEGSTHPDMLNQDDMGMWWDEVIQNRLVIAEAREEIAKMTPKTELVARGSTWSYLAPADGIDPATTDPDFHETFFLPEFDDRRWKTGIDAGNGLGYGDPVDVEWPTPPEGKRYSAYLRHRFTLAEPMTSLTFCTQYDDGFICYLDGVRLGHSPNMRNSSEGFEVLATSTIGDGEKAPFLLEISEPVLLEPGEHVLAISLHSATTVSSDLRIADIRLLGTPQSELERMPTPDLVPAVAARSDFDLMNQHALEEDWDTVKKHALAIRFGTDAYHKDPSSVDLMAHGTALLRAGEREEYERHCTLMLGEFRLSKDPLALGVTSKTILVDPKSRDSPLRAEAIEFARRAGELGRGTDGRMMTLCLAELRAGNYPEVFRIARETRWHWAHYRVGGLAVQAMAAHAENDTEKARTFLDEARAAAKSMKMVNDEWFDIEIPRMLLEEAEALIARQ